MIRKTEKLLITFYTTTDAMAMEDMCKKHHVAGRIIPVPGSISADCGLGWCAEPNDETVLREFIEKQNLRTQGIHQCVI